MRHGSPDISILIASGHAMFGEGLRSLFAAEPGFRVIAEAHDGEEALKLARQLKPDILLLGLYLPGMSGLDVIRELDAASCPSCPILLTRAIEREGVIQALQAGARGVVLKKSSFAVLLKCIRCVMDGEFWVGRESTGDLVNALSKLASAPPPHAEDLVLNKTFGLTPRELQLVSAIVQGYTNKQIAQDLSRSEDTVKKHLTSIFDKTGVGNRLELAIFAMHHKLTGDAKK